LKEVDDLKAELQKQQTNPWDDKPDSKIALPPKMVKKEISVPKTSVSRHSPWLHDLEEE